MQVSHILETCLYVNDLPAAERFYAEVLGLTLLSRQPGRHAFFRCGQRMLLLFDPRESSQPGQQFPQHGATGPGHVAFAVTEAELPRWQAHLQSQNVPVEQIIDWPTGGRSLYFRDPANNSLELANPRIWGISESSLLTSETK